MSRTIIKGIIFFFAFLLIKPISLRSLNPETPIDKYIHHIWTTRDLLPQNTINCIAQDSSGYLWIGTDRGLTRFDGSYFKTINKGNLPALKNNSITSLIILPDNEFWIGTYGGGITHYKDGKYKNFSAKEGLINQFINVLAIDNKHNLCIGTTGDGLIKYNYNNDSFTAITDQQGLSYNIVTGILNDRHGRLWVGTEQGLNLLEKGQITVYTTADGLPSDGIITIIEDHHGNVWVGTKGGIGLTRNRAIKVTGKKFIQITKKDGLTDNFISFLAEDKEKNIWIATNKGLNRIKTINYRNRLFDKFKLQIDNFTTKNGLSDNSLRYLYEDRWGNLWVGTSGGGLNVLKDSKFNFYTEKDGLSSSYVSAIYEDRHETVWIGTNGSGLNSFKNGKFTTYQKRDGLSSNYIESLGSDKYGNLWIGTTNGLSLFKNGKFQSFGTADGLSNPSIRVLYLDSYNILWIGTFGGGLNFFKDGKFKSLDKKKGLSDNFVLTITEDLYNNIWIGTNKGLNCFDRDFFRHLDKRAEVPQGRILDIYCDPTGTLWIASSDLGLIRFKNGKFTPLKNTEALNNQTIYRIVEDHRENLWLSSNKGIFSISRRRLNWFMEGRGSFLDWRHYQEDDGLETSVCSGGFQPAGWLTANNNLWIPTIKGIAVIDLSKPRLTIKKTNREHDLFYKLDEHPENNLTVQKLNIIHELPVRIEHIVADNQVYRQLNRLVLPSDTRKIQFHFKAIDYSTSENVLFKYRLKNYDKKWLRSNKRQSKVYQNIPPGDYQFEVVARYSDGKWGYTGASCFFSIQSPFTQTFWFYLLLTSSISLLVFGLPRLIEIIVKKKNKTAEKYKNSNLTNPKVKHLMNRLTVFMKKEKPYLNTELSLQYMANRLNVTPKDLSQVINEQLNCNFKNFINKYRVEDAKKKLIDPNENQFVLMKIALDVGFNSKSVFNASFKKFTGMTPSQYREKYKQK